MTCNMIGHLIKLIISEVVCTWPIMASPEFVSHFFLFRSRYYLRLAILSVTLPNLIISEAVHTWLIISPEFYLWINLLSTNRNNIDARKQETPHLFHLIWGLRIWRVVFELLSHPIILFQEMDSKQKPKISVFNSKKIAKKFGENNRFGFEFNSKFTSKQRSSRFLTVLLNSIKSAYLITIALITSITPNIIYQMNHVVHISSLN